MGKIAGKARNAKLGRLVRLNDTPTKLGYKRKSKAPPARKSTKLKPGQAAKRTKESGAFQNSDKRIHHGRPLGAVNRLHGQVKEAIVEAANRHGSDGKGKDMLVGYMFRLAKYEPRAFASLLGRIVPMQMVGELQVNGTSMSRSEVVLLLKERGLPTDRAFAEPAPPAEMRQIEGQVVKAVQGDVIGEAAVKSFTGVAPRSEQG